MAPLRKSLPAIFTFTQAGLPQAKAASRAGPSWSTRLDVGAEAADGLDDLLVARVVERGRDRALDPVELHLAAADLRPARVVADRRR
jgi:hypothetical protein